MAVLLAVACFITYYYHAVLKVGTVFTHLFYLPIFLAAFWWKKKGLIVAVFLASLLIVSHHFFRIDIVSANDYLRAGMFIMVGFIVAKLNEHIAGTKQKMQETNEYLESLLTYASVPIIVWDPEFKITRFNHAFERLVGKTAKDVLGSSIDILFPGDRCDEAMRQIRRAVKGEQWKSVEIPILSAGGEVRTVLWNSANLYAPDGKTIIATIAQGQDITERKRTEEKLIAYQQKLRSLTSELSLAEERERRRIASGLHDDVSQNLVLLKMRLANMHKKGLSAESVDDMYNRIDQVIQNTRNLTFDLSSPMLYDLGLEAAIRQWLMTQLQQMHGFQCTFENDGEPKPLDEDIRVLLFQAVKELLVNVVRHSHAANVKVSVQKKDNKIQVSVEDDGVGFAGTKGEGAAAEMNGFGLFSIRQRLDYIDGSVKIKSQPSHGSRITLEAPLKSEV